MKIMPKQYVFLVALGPLLMMIVGVAMLVAQSRVRWRARDRRPGLMVLALAALGWSLLLIGLFASVMIMANVVAPLAFLATAIVLLEIRYHYQRMEQRSLLWVLTVAAERGIPLEQAARDFAAERRDWIGSRSLDLAEYLEAGLPLALAAQRSRLAFPSAILLAADMGQRAGNLGPALRQALSRDDTAETVLRSAVEELFYVTFLIAFGLCLWAFVMLKIVPAFCHIFKDFDVPLPAATQGMIAAARFVFDFWPLMVLVAAMLLVLLVRAVLYYAGMSAHILPGVGRLGRAADSAIVMRWLAVAVRGNRPVVEMLRLLAGYFPRRAIRRKLDWTAKRIDQGADWSETLAQAGLIRRAEVAVFNAAQRTGNLAWALDEMAQSSLRRAAYRLRAALGVVFPAVVLLLGAAAVLVALGCLSPLVALIGGLT